MKNLALLLILFLTFNSCDTTKIDYTKAELASVTWYDFNGNLITLNDIISKWNKRIQQKEQINTEIRNLEISYVLDKKNSRKTLVLIGNTNLNSVKTATKLTEFRNGLKLSEIVATCNNCRNSELNIGLSNGNWFCMSDKQINNCEKIVTLRTK